MNTLKVLTFALAFTLAGVLARAQCPALSGDSGAAGGCTRDKVTASDTHNTTPKGGADSPETKAACGAKDQAAADMKNCPSTPDCPKKADGSCCKKEGITADAAKASAVQGQGADSPEAQAPCGAKDKAGCTNKENCPHKDKCPVNADSHSCKKDNVTADAAKASAVQGQGADSPEAQAPCGAKDKASCTKENCPHKDACKKEGITADAAKAPAAAVPGGGEATGKPKSVGPYAVGSTIDAFTLPDAKTGKEVSLKDVAGEKATVLIFWNQNCPYVQEVQGRVADFHNAYKDKGVKVVAVDAGVNNAPEEIKQYAGNQPFPLLVNRDSKIAAKFDATRTPEVFLLDKDMNVVYHGAFDSGRTKAEDGARKTYVADTVDALLKGEKPAVTETKAFGCSLKYAEGAKPAK